MVARQVTLLDPLPTTLTPLFRYSCELFVAPKKVKSFGIKQIPHSFCKIPGVGVFPSRRSNLRTFQRFNQSCWSGITSHAVSAAWGLFRSLGPLFEALSFVFNGLQPLFAKYRGVGYPECFNGAPEWGVGCTWAVSSGSAGERVSKKIARESLRPLHWEKGGIDLQNHKGGGEDGREVAAVVFRGYAARRSGCGWHCAQSFETPAHSVAFSLLRPRWTDAFKLTCHLGRPVTSTLGAGLRVC
jgi:hypothetical protein